MRGDQVDYRMRVYDGRLGRFLSVDPLSQKFPWYTPYQFAGKTPVQSVDLDGLEDTHYIFIWAKDKSGIETVVRLAGWHDQVQTGADKNGVATFDRPQRIIAHYPTMLTKDRTIWSQATYNSEAEFENAKGRDFMWSGVLGAANEAAGIANDVGTIMTASYLVAAYGTLAKQGIAQYID